MVFLRLEALSNGSCLKGQSLFYDNYPVEMAIPQSSIEYIFEYPEVVLWIGFAQCFKRFS